MLELIPYNTIFYLLNIISNEKQSNIILSVDVSDINKFKSIILSCGKYVVAIKIHLDIFNENERDDLRNFLD